MNVAAWLLASEIIAQDVHETWIFPITVCILFFFLRGE
jgi:hypothetical protein